MKLNNMKLGNMFDQAKDSALDTWQDTWQAAKKFVHLNSIKLPPELTLNRRELTDKRILASLKKLGVATKPEIRLLESRIEKLEAQLKAQRKSSKSST